MLQTSTTHGKSPSEYERKSTTFSFSGVLNSLGTVDKLPEYQFRWNSNEEVFVILTSLEHHNNWLQNEVKIRPPNGSILLFNRSNLKTKSYQNDKYFWKTRKNSKSSARVDHSSLRIRGIECIYCSYVHSALVPTFHRRCYWLLENPDIVLVHYLNIPDKNITFDNLVVSLLPYKALSEQELKSQLQPIMAVRGDVETNPITVLFDVNKLVTSVKNYKERKTKTRRTHKKVSGNTTKKESASLTATRSFHDSPQLNKCAKCNSCYTETNSVYTTTNYPRTNVAVTINKQTSRVKSREANRSIDTFLESTSRISGHEKSFSERQTFHQQNSSFVDDSAVILDQRDCLPNSETESHSMHKYQEVLALQSSGNICTEDRFPRSDYNIPGKQIISTSSDINCHEIGQNLLINYPVTRDQSLMTNNNENCSLQFDHGPCCFYSSSDEVSPEANTVMLNEDSVVLDYDGMNLVQSNEGRSEFDDKLLISANDAYLFENEFLNFVPDNLPELEAHLKNNLTVISSSSSSNTFSSPVISRDVITVCNTPQLPARNHTISQSSAKNSTLCSSDAVRRTVCSPTEVISTDCQAFGNFMPSLLNFTEIEDSFATDVHQCTSTALGNDRGRKEECVSKVNSCADGTNEVSCSSHNNVIHTSHDTVTLNLDDSLMKNNPSLPSSGEVSNANNVNSSQLGEDLAKSSVPNFSQNPIADYSPDWSYCEGESKVLILGDWSHENGMYSCLFDGCCVAATKIQSGVLRCFCPPHEPGLVSLQVAWNGIIISNTCVFEYRLRESASTSTSTSDWLTLGEENLTKTILKQIERLEKMLGIVGDVDGEVAMKKDVTYEDRLFKICRSLLGKAEARKLSDLPNDRITLLHLAAGLGYTKLIHFLRTHSSSQLVVNAGTTHKSTMFNSKITEWSPTSTDSFGRIPLMWACARGHEDAALVLLEWEPSSYAICDQFGWSAKTITEKLGNIALVEKMNAFICKKDMNSLITENSPQSPRSSYVNRLVSPNEQTPVSPMSTDSLTCERVDGVSENTEGFEAANGTSDDRPNTLGKVLVEIRTLIEQAEERSRSPPQTSTKSAPYSLTFSHFPDVQQDEHNQDKCIASDAEFRHHVQHLDTLSIDSSPVLTPSCHSPVSPVMMNSSPSTGTDTSEFEEFLSKPRHFLERDFSELTLTDVEQKELLQAAKVIQNAYRQFKIRKKQHMDELEAAVLIQSYYRRYKQFALYKKMTKAAVFIQNSYRARKEHEQFKRSRHAASVIQTYFRHYRKRKQRNAEEDSPFKRLETKYRKSSSNS